MFSNPFVYFIQGECTGLIKIGKTMTLIEQRLKQLQTGSPDKLNFLGGYLGELSENDIHTQFQEYRLHGEWFRASESLKEFISKNCIHDAQALHYAVSEIENGNMTVNEAMALKTKGLLGKHSELMVKLFSDAL
ncbi:GIY-YIG nuclease family protein [Vibrio penaeicida]|uniref:Bacteriophage T5 Orf172 DNA-binding domain-containing protein n=1 Tax=Vibrio penaeicida TaxID=104609 RepID=A0AAV5NW96_9VIBR|nr:GIY-YIG nuclease family protein [Vibrio penaeicida]GLQ74703.1 hypothetical protein GCM10007932_40640 [Vibrio penaeicida]